MSPPRKKQKLRGRDGKFMKNEHQRETAPPQPDYEPPSGPASERLLATTELLENILLHLPMKDLLLAQRVSKSWDKTIQASISLRRALFFEPVVCGDISYLDWRYDDKCMYPDSLKLGEHLRGAKRDARPKIYQRHWGKGRDDVGKYRIFVNPLLSGLFPVLREDGCYWREMLHDLPVAARYQFASWRRMYFTQPPVGSMILEWDSGPDPAIVSDDEDGSEDDEADEDGNDGNATGAQMPAINPLTTLPPVPVTPALPAANGANGGWPGNTGGTGRGDEADWTLSCYSKWSETKGMLMEDLFWRLEEDGHPAWIDGRDLWEEYHGVEDLGRVVVRGK